jgi:hypothetical protein
MYRVLGVDNYFSEDEDDETEILGYKQPWDDRDHA